MHIDEVVKAIALLLTAIPKILKFLEQIMTTQAELDAKLDELDQKEDKVILLVGSLQTAIAELNAKIGTVTSVDLTPETAKVDAIMAKLSGILPAATTEPTPVTGTVDPAAVASSSPTPTL